jgi:hypothetical protein
MEGATTGVKAADLESSADIQSLLKTGRPVSEGAAHLLTENEWEALCTYVQMLNKRLP